MLGLARARRSSGRLRRRAIFASSFTVMLVLLANPTPTYAQVTDETRFIFNTLSFLIWGQFGDVDGRRIHHARVRISAHEERVGHLPQEHRPVCDRRDRVSTLSATN